MTRWKLKRRALLFYTTHELKARCILFPPEMNQRFQEKMTVFLNSQFLVADWIRPKDLKRFRKTQQVMIEKWRKRYKRLWKVEEEEKK